MGTDQPGRGEQENAKDAEQYRDRNGLIGRDQFPYLCDLCDLLFDSPV